MFAALMGGSQVSNARPPEFPARSPRQGRVCAFLHGKAREIAGNPPNFAGNRGPGAPIILFIRDVPFDNKRFSSAFKALPPVYEQQVGPQHVLAIAAAGLTA